MDRPIAIPLPQAIARLQNVAQVRPDHQPALARPTVHITLQGKGGVGKSLVSVMLAQYLRRSSAAPRCIDTDPVNDTFAQFKAIGARHLSLMRDGRVDPGIYDTLIGQILAEPSNFVVDCGATSFIALTNYLAEIDALDILRTEGREVIIHVVIAGGQALRDTVIGLRLLATTAHPRSLVIWLNEYFGPIQAVEEISGEQVVKPFTEMRVYEENEAKILGLVTLPRLNPDTFGRNMQEMLSQKLTFDEIRQSDRWQLMSKSRMHRIERDIFGQLDAVFG
jgi:hypothetical protein